MVNDDYKFLWVYVLFLFWFVSCGSFVSFLLSQTLSFITDLLQHMVWLVPGEFLLACGFKEQGSQLIAMADIYDRSNRV